MTYKNLLLHLEDGRHGVGRAELAVRLAKACDASITAVYVTPPPAPPGIEAQRAEAAARAEVVRREFEAMAAGVATEWRCQEGERRDIVGLAARYHDLAIVGQTEAERVGSSALQLPEQVVLDSGGPVLVVPLNTSFEQLGQTIAVAWNASRPAARAVHDALPLLVRATQVTVLELDDPESQGRAATELSRRLERHGVAASPQYATSGEASTGEALLSFAAARGADLLVMGAYGHARLRELFLGGATRTVLEKATIPLLLSA